jgi:hypothetical protein
MYVREHAIVSAARAITRNFIRPFYLQVTIVFTPAERMNTPPDMLPEVNAVHVVPSIDVSHALEVVM